jgi:hypothetical protein
MKTAKPAKNSAKQSKSRGGAFEPGQSGNPAGRPKGAVNKVTADVRAALAQLAEGNVGRCQEWLDAVAMTNPERALDLYLRIIEYHVPKLARSEIAVEGELRTGTVSAEPLTPEEWVAKHGGE